MQISFEDVNAAQPKHPGFVQLEFAICLRFANFRSDSRRHSPHRIQATGWLDVWQRLRQINADYRRRLGESISFEDSFAKAFFKMPGKIERQFFRAGDGEAQAAKLIWLGFTQVHAQKSGRRQQECQFISLDQRGAPSRFQLIWRFIRGISSSNFKTRSGHGKSLIRSMNCVAEIATRRLARPQHDSFAARPMVKLRSTGTFPASVTARFAIIDPLFAGKTMAIRSSANCLRRKRLNAAAAPSNFDRLRVL